MITSASKGYDPLDLLSISELAELWSVHPTTVRRWIAAGELESVQLGSRRRVPRAAAEDYMRRHSTRDGTSR
jgi:excisionase family DNA binding protein